VREVPQFFNLSESQQNYVLGKLREKTKHNIDENVKEELNNVKGLKRLFNGFRAGKVRKEIVKKTKEGGVVDNLSAGWRENGEATYSVDIVCSTPNDPRCANDMYLKSFIASLVYVGGSGK
jgi:hypothetical protein